MEMEQHELLQAVFDIQGNMLTADRDKNLAALLKLRELYNLNGHKVDIGYASLSSDRFAAEGSRIFNAYVKNNGDVNTIAQADLDKFGPHMIDGIAMWYTKLLNISTSVARLRGELAPAGAAATKTKQKEDYYAFIGVFTSTCSKAHQQGLLFAVQREVGVVVPPEYVFTHGTLGVVCVRLISSETFGLIYLPDTFPPALYNAFWDAVNMTSVEQSRTSLSEAFTNGAQPIASLALMNARNHQEVACHLKKRDDWKVGESIFKDTLPRRSFLGAEPIQAYLLLYVILAMSNVRDRVSRINNNLLPFFTRFLSEPEKALNMTDRDWEKLRMDPVFLDLFGSSLTCLANEMSPAEKKKCFRFLLPAQVSEGLSVKRLKYDDHIIQSAHELVLPPHDQKHRDEKRGCNICGRSNADNHAWAAGAPKDGKHRTPNSCPFRGMTSKFYLPTTYDATTYDKHEYLVFLKKK